MSGDSFVVRRAGPDDAAALAEFAARTFEDTYGAFNAPEHMAEHLAASFGEPKQRAELLNPAWVTIFIEIERGLVGYAQLRQHPRPVSVPLEHAVELHRFYVASRWHGTGAAHMLMSAVRVEARETGATHLWLGVWEHNPRAIAFYTKCGFQHVGETVFLVGPDQQRDRVLLAALDVEQTT